MKKPLIFLSLLLGLLLFQSCSHYPGMKLAEHRYRYDIVQEDLQLQYTFNYLHTLSAAHYAQRAENEQIQLIALQIENQGIEPIELGRTHLMVLNGKPVSFIDSHTLFENLRLRFRGFVPTLMLSPLVGLAATGEGEEEANSNSNEAVLFLALLAPVTVLGAGIGMLADNSNLRDDLDNMNLFGRIISAGEKSQGLVAVRHPPASLPKELKLIRIDKY